MANHSNEKISGEDPDFNRALEELRIAWENGRPASSDAAETAKIKLLSRGYTRKAAEAIVVLKATKTGAGASLAGEQKYKLLLAAAPAIAVSAEKLISSIKNAVVAPKKKVSWKGQLQGWKEEMVFLEQFKGYYQDSEFANPISVACSLSRLAVSCKSGPSAGFVTGLRAKSRISKLLVSAEGVGQTESWAATYLLSSVNSIGDIGKDADSKADAIVNVLEASAPLKTAPQFRRAFIRALAEKDLARSGELTSVGRKVSLLLRRKSRGKRQELLAGLHKEFRGALQPKKAEETQKHYQGNTPRKHPDAAEPEAEEELKESTAPGQLPIHIKDTGNLMGGGIGEGSSFQEPETMDARLSIAAEGVRNMQWAAWIAFEEYGPAALPYLVQAVSDLMATSGEEEAFSYLKDYIVHSIAISYAYSKDEEARQDALSEILVNAEAAGHGLLAAEINHLLGFAAEPKAEEGQEEATVPGPVHVHGIGMVPRGRDRPAEAKQAETAAEGQDEQEGGEAEHGEDVLLEAPQEHAESRKNILIFKKLDEAIPLLDEIASADVPLPDRTYAAGELANLLDAPGRSPQKLIQELSFLAFSEDQNHSAKATAAMLSLPYTSQHDWVSRRNSSLLVSVLAGAVQSNSKGSFPPEVEIKFLHGSEEEADYAIDVLAQKARLYGAKTFCFPESTPPQEIALAEAYRTMEPARFSRIALVFKGLGAETETLNHYLNLAMEADPAAVQKTLLTVLNSHRAQKPGSIFPPDTGEAYLDSEAEAAEDFFFWFGKGEESLRETSIAAGVSEISTDESARFMVQRLGDATDEDEIATWSILLQEFKGSEADVALRQAFNLLTLPRKEEVVSLLSSRPPSMDNAEFLLSLCASEDNIIAAISADALLEMGFSGLDTEREFSLLFRMRNHPNPKLVQDAETGLLALLEGRGREFSTNSVEGLSSLYLNDANPQIRERARELLLRKCSESVTGPAPLELISAKQPDALLAAYALASEMQHDPEHLPEDVLRALERFSGNPIATMHLMVAATASHSEKYAGIVLVPQLGGDEIFSEVASTFLLHMGGAGVRAAARAANRENLPNGVSPEMAKRISDKAIETLCTAEAFKELVPLLASPSAKVRSSVYGFIEDSIGAGRDTDAIEDALLDGIYSEQKSLRLAALNLLPQKQEHLDCLIGLVDGEDEEVSALSARLAAPLLSPRGLIRFLNQQYPFSAKQAVADAYLVHSPEAVGEIASLAEEEGIGHEAISALGFFQVPETLTCFLEFEEKVDEKGRKALADSLSQFCRTISESKESTEEEMLMLLIAYDVFSYREVHNEIMSAIIAGKAGLAAAAAIKSEEPMLLFSATKLFLSAGMEGHALSTAKKLREIGAGIPSEQLTEPYQRVLFGGEADMMGKIDSPFRNREADPGPYRLVKNIALDQMANGRGSPSSYSLLLLFLDEFGKEDKEGLFDAGLKAVSEVVWLHRDEAKKYRDKLAGRLPNYVAKGISDEVKALAEILLLHNYGKINSLQEAPGKNEPIQIVVEHALRHLVEASVSFPHTLSPEAAKSKLMLLAELQTSGRVSGQQIVSVASQVNPIALAVAGRPLTKEEFENGKCALGLALEAIEAESHRAKTEYAKMQQIARTDAAKLGRKVRTNPSSEPAGAQVLPKRPTRGRSQPPLKK
jgi:hypothetical protein